MAEWSRVPVGLIAFGLAAAVMIAGCLGLGIWQLDRLSWKTDLMATVAGRIDGPAIDLAAAVADPAAADFRPIRLTGRFDHAAEMQVGARTVDRIGGVDLMTPLRVTQGADAGRTVLVLRGWVPLDRRAAATRPGSRPDATMVVAGWVRQPVRRTGWADLVLPADRPDAGYWLRIDLDSMAAAAGLAEPLPVYVQAGPDAADPTGLPRGRAPAVDLPNPHLSYALTWFGLAAVLSAMLAWRLWPRRAGGAD